MKSAIAFLMVLCACCPVWGAIINTGNLWSLEGDTVVTDSTGTPVRPLHAFMSIDSGLAGVRSLEEFRSVLATGIDVLPGTNQFLDQGEGFYNLAYNGPDGMGEPIYVILADTANLIDALHLGLIDTGETLDQDGASIDANSYLLAEGNGTPLVGHFSPELVTAEIFDLQNTGPQFVLAPEPSLAMLAMLATATLGFVRRRGALR